MYIDIYQVHVCKNSLISKISWKIILMGRVNVLSEEKTPKIAIT